MRSWRGWTPWNHHRRRDQPGRAGETHLARTFARRAGRPLIELSCEPLLPVPGTVPKGRKPVLRRGSGLAAHCSSLGSVLGTPTAGRWLTLLEQATYLAHDKRRRRALVVVIPSPRRAWGQVPRSVARRFSPSQPTRRRRIDNTEHAGFEGPYASHLNTDLMPSRGLSRVEVGGACSCRSGGWDGLVARDNQRASRKASSWSGGW
jgi:hypothetical protein